MWTGSSQDIIFARGRAERARNAAGCGQLFSPDPGGIREYGCADLEFLRKQSVRCGGKMAGEDGINGPEGE